MIGHLVQSPRDYAIDALAGALLTIPSVINRTVHSGDRRRLADTLLALPLDALDATLSAFALGGPTAAALTLGKVIREPGRRWVRIVPTSKRKTHVLAEVYFTAGTWFSVAQNLALLCLEERDEARQLLFKQSLTAPEDGEALFIP